MTTADKVSEDLLAAFDDVVNAGETLPLEEIKKRYRGSDHFSFRDFQLYEDVIELPVTVAMVMGDTATASQKVLAGIREMYGDDELMFRFSSGGDECKLHIRKWKSEEALRKLWREFAEETYKSELQP